MALRMMQKLVKASYHIELFKVAYVVGTLSRLLETARSSAILYPEYLVHLIDAWLSVEVVGEEGGGWIVKWEGMLKWAIFKVNKNKTREALFSASAIT